MTLDKVSIGLSLLCSLQCLAIPLLVVFLPTVSFLSGEGLHNILLVLVLPISGYALTLGYKQHQNVTVLLIGITGLIMLCMAFLLGHVVFGESVEKTLTVLASMLVAYAHYLNFKQCSFDVECDCHSESGQ
jgi:hypothetical protein